MPLVKNVQEIAYHRNGVCGEGFHAVRFRGDIEAVGEREAALMNIQAGPKEPDAHFLAIVFDGPGQCAVICLDYLEKYGVKFSFNSWRGDRYEPELRRAIAQSQETP